MRRPFNIFILIFFAATVFTITAHGEVRHAQNPMGNIENILGEGEFVWNINDTQRADLEKEALEMGKTFTVKDIRWTVKGGGQDWVLTRTTRMGEGNEASVKQERFWITLLRVDGKWVSRTKYRFRQAKPREGESLDVNDNDNGGKFSARCRITHKKIILSLTRKKQGHFFKITGNGSSMQVDYFSVQDLAARSITFKK
jgi:hypothetical protein